MHEIPFVAARNMGWETLVWRQIPSYRLSCNFHIWWSLHWSNGLETGDGVQRVDCFLFQMCWAVGGRVCDFRENACACVCVIERENMCVWNRKCVYVCVCVCVWEREREIMCCLSHCFFLCGLKLQLIVGGNLQLDPIDDDETNSVRSYFFNEIFEKVFGLIIILSLFLHNKAIFKYTSQCQQ